MSKYLGDITCWLHDPSNHLRVTLLLNQPGNFYAGTGFGIPSLVFFDLHPLGQTCETSEEIRNRGQTVDWEPKRTMECSGEMFPVNVHYQQVFMMIQGEVSEVCKKKSFFTSEFLE